MAKKISQLTQATQVKSDDVTVIVQDGETKKLPLNTLVTKQDIENKKVAGLAKLDEIEATYENDTYTPTITVKNKSSVKVGEGDGVDYSANVMDGPAKSAILKGSTKYRDIDTGEILESFEEGRNLELVSVKMPVLTTTGKNLFDIKEDTIAWGGANIKSNSDNTITFTPNSNNNASLSGNLYFKQHIKVKTGTKYTYSVKRISGGNADFSGSINNQILVRKKDGTIAERVGMSDFYTNTFNQTLTATYVFDDTVESIIGIKPIMYAIGNLTSPIIMQFQLEEGTQATSYEPYKSNILTVNEGVELRGVGDVKDELNLLTGEVTERIGEIVLDGTQDMSSDGKGVYIQLNDVKRLLDYTGKIACDKLPVIPTYVDLENVENGISGFTNSGSYLGQNWLYVKINNSVNTDEVKEWLTQNPITVQYQLETESIKTVDLMPSGTHPSTTPYCWKNGHIQLSSSGLLPNLEYSVVTSRAGQINQNATMIVKNDKRIFDLEILLAGGLVNTTYQALTLQNQVETGLSKVSLNSETEPDYLLYHMIMKLIEEKAYKLDDLTEKVSVFYLYEKLSDEQFETIYSALYPFVEDEIVEEPVVEELPEVVEDEVIM